MGKETAEAICLLQWRCCATLRERVRDLPIRSDKQNCSGGVMRCYEGSVLYVHGALDREHESETMSEARRF